MILGVFVFVSQTQAIMTYGATTATSDGNYTLDGMAGSVYSFGPSTITGSIAMGGVSQTGAITLGQSTDDNTIVIGNANTAAAKTQTINIGAGTPAGTDKAVITIGNTNGASSVNINTGTGNFAVNTSQLYVDQANGRVGIGTTSPSYKLDVMSTIVSNWIGSLRSDGNGWVGLLVENQINDTASYATVGAQAMQATGLTSIQIQQFASNSTATFSTYNSTTSPLAGYSRLIGGARSKGLFIIVPGNNGPGEAPIVFGTNSMERRRLTFAGNLGIGTSSPNGKLDIIGTVTASANYGLVNIGSAAIAFDGSTAGYFVGSANGTELAINAVSGFTGNLIDAQVAGSSKFSVTNAGAVTIAGSTNYGALAGGTTAYTLAVSIPALADGAMVTFKVNATSTGSVTLNVNSLGAKKMIKGSDNATQIGNGDLVSNGFYWAIYNSSFDTGTGAWVILNK